MFELLVFVWHIVHVTILTSELVRIAGDSYLKATGALEKKWIACIAWS